MCALSLTSLKNRAIQIIKIETIRPTKLDKINMHIENKHIVCFFTV